MYKQIIIARKDLGMSPGKLSSQVADASMAFLLDPIREISFTTKIVKPQYQYWDPWENMSSVERLEDIVEYNFKYTFDKDLYEQWLDGDFTKCVLQARNKNHLLKAETMARDLGMHERYDFFLIYDSCRTEIEPEEDDKTLTCIGFKPMDAEIIDNIGRKYQLYR